MISHETLARTAIHSNIYHDGDGLERHQDLLGLGEVNENCDEMGKEDEIVEDEIGIDNAH